MSRRDAVAEEAQRISGVGIWYYDYATGLVTWSNEEFRIFGVSPDTFNPTFESFLELVHPDDREAMRAANDASATGRPMDFEHRIVRPDGEVRHVREQAQIVLNDALGGRPMLLGTTQDITERKRAEELVSAQALKLREIEAEMNFLARRSAMATMAETLAHEINQPLTAAFCYAASLRRKIEAIDTDRSISADLAGIENGVFRAAEIIQQIRGTAEQRQLRRDRIDFDALVRECVECLAFGSGDVLFRFEGRATGTVLADHIQMEQVLTNLFRNACEAMEDSDPKIITISTVEDAAQVTICVSDTGPGLPRDLRPFEAIVSGKETGMGIGLSICRTIIDSNGGRIWTEPSAAGARVCFSLPRADADSP